MEPEKTEITGDKLKEIETIERIRQILTDFLRGYPIWQYHGIFEYYFGKDKGLWIIKELDKHKILNVSYTKKRRIGMTLYSLTPRGVEIAISLSNREDSKRILRFTEETYKLNKLTIGLTIAMLIGIGMQIYLAFMLIP